MILSIIDRIRIPYYIFLKKMIFSNDLSFKKLEIFLFFFLFLFSFLVQENQAKNLPFFIKQYYPIFKSSMTLRREGDFKQAIYMFKHALYLAKKFNNVEEQLICLENLALLYWNIGLLEDSLDNYKKSLFLLNNHNQKNIKIRCQKAIEIHKLYIRGKEFRASNDYNKSIENFEKAIQISRKLGSKEHEVKCLRQLSLTYDETNNIKEFLNLNKEALKIAKDINHYIEKGRCLINIGNFYKKIANYSKALNCYDQALNIINKLNNKEDASICMNNIGIIYQNLGDYDRALKYLKNALEIDRCLKDYINISMDLNNIGTIFRAKAISSDCRDDLYRSLFYFNKCIKYSRDSMYMKDKIKILKKIEIQAMNNIGVVLIDLDDMTCAKKYLRPAYYKSLENRNLEVAGMSLVNLGIVFMNQCDYKKSIKSFNDAVKIANKIYDSQILWEAYFGLGQCYEKIHEYSKSVECYENSIAVIDMIRSQIILDSHNAGFSRDKLKVYEFLINLLYKLSNKIPSLSNSKEIFHIVERAKARAFLENLVQSKGEVSKKLSPKLRKEKDAISNRIFLMKQKLSNHNMSRKNRNEILIKLQREEEKYMSLISKVDLEVPVMKNLIPIVPCRVEQIQMQLSENTALIEYFLGENQSLMFLITKNEILVFSLPSKDVIENSIKAFLKILTIHSKGEFKGILAAERIYNELLFPAENKFKGSIKNLIVIPDGILYYLPFETLVKSSHNTKIKGDFLIKEYNISYAPSSSVLSFLLRKNRRIEGSKALFALGNPSYPYKIPSKLNNKIIYTGVLRELFFNKGFVISSLPYSGKEILRISNYFKRELKSIFVKKDAREEIIKEISLIDYRIIHFACHALLDEEISSRSALVLSISSDSKEDGFLQVREIYNLSLNADLVVLSACQTGRGKLEKGEGILGFPRVFFYIGAKSVLFSIWRINDKSTSTFMNQFYYYLSQGKNKTQALRLAKLDMIESKYCHPYYWAAFVLNGDFISSISFD